jgi:hypothetical protein
MSAVWGMAVAMRGLPLARARVSAHRQRREPRRSAVTAERRHPSEGRPTLLDLMSLIAEGFAPVAGSAADSASSVELLIAVLLGVAIPTSFVRPAVLDDPKSWPFEEVARLRFCVGYRGLVAALVGFSYRGAGEHARVRESPGLGSTTLFQAECSCFSWWPPSRPRSSPGQARRSRQAPMGYCWACAADRDLRSDHRNCVRTVLPQVQQHEPVQTRARVVSSKRRDLLVRVGLQPLAGFGTGLSCPGCPVSPNDDEDSDGRRLPRAPHVLPARRRPARQETQPAVNLLLNPFLHGSTLCSAHAQALITERAAAGSGATRTRLGWIRTCDLFGSAHVAAGRSPIRSVYVSLYGTRMTRPQQCAGGLQATAATAPHHHWQPRRGAQG